MRLGWSRRWAYIPASTDAGMILPKRQQDTLHWWPRTYSMPSRVNGTTIWLGCCYCPPDFEKGQTLFVCHMLRCPRGRHLVILEDPIQVGSKTWLFASLGCFYFLKFNASNIYNCPLRSSFLKRAAIQMISGMKQQKYYNDLETGVVLPFMCD